MRCKVLGVYYCQSLQLPMLTIGRIFCTWHAIKDEVFMKVFILVIRKFLTKVDKTCFNCYW